MEQDYNLKELKANGWAEYRLLVLARVDSTA